MTAIRLGSSEWHVVVRGCIQPSVAKYLLIQITQSFLHLLHPNRVYRIKKVECCTGGSMETLGKKSFWGAMVFVAVFVTSIVLLLADNARAR
jgi:hypothetical protein